MRLKNIILIGLLGFITTNLRCLQDRISPEVYFVYPQENSQISGAIRIKVVATDNRGVSYVEFYINNQLKGVDKSATGPIYEYLWDISREAAGEKSVRAVAYDSRGNTGEAEIRVRIRHLGPTYHYGTITTDELWTKEGNPHIITSDLRIKAILTIEPGVIVKSDEDCAIIVEEGDIIARGSSSEPIFWTSSSDEPYAGVWTGIFLEEADYSNTIFDNCVIEYAVNGIWVVEREVWLTNSLIRYSEENGVLCESGRFIQFNNNIITRNEDYPICITQDAVYTLGTGNYLLGNTGHEIADAIKVGSKYKKETDRKVKLEKQNSSEPENHTIKTWRNHGVPYIITSEIHLEENATLLIEPGCILAFEYDGIWIHAGKFIAHHATFTSLSALEGFPNPGDWAGIYISEEAQAELKNCVIEYAGGNGDGGLTIDNLEEYQSVVINSCIIRHSSEAGILLYEIAPKAELQVTGTRIYGCQYPAFLSSADLIRTLGPNNNFLGNEEDIIYVSDDGNIYSSGIWYNSRVPYFIDTDLIITEGFNGQPPIITIMPGVIMKFASYVSFIVEYGALIADGTGGTIVFTNSEEDEYWGGLVLEEEIDNYLTRIKNCIIQNAGISSTHPANITCNECRPQISNNEICYSGGWGMLLRRSPLDPDSLRRYNRFFDNDSGDIRVDTTPIYSIKARNRKLPKIANHGSDEEKLYKNSTKHQSLYMVKQ
jgi:hypothetical protein